MRKRHRSASPVLSCSSYLQWDETSSNDKYFYFALLKAWRRQANLVSGPSGISAHISNRSNDIGVNLLVQWKDKCNFDKESLFSTDILFNIVHTCLLLCITCVWRGISRWSHCKCRCTVDCVQLVCRLGLCRRLCRPTFYFTDLSGSICLCGLSKDTELQAFINWLC